MCKIGKKVYSAAARLFDAARQLNVVRVFGATLLGCAMLFSGCINDDNPFGGLNKVTVQLSVGSRTVDETGGTPSEAESKINTLRVYAFVGGRPAGHYFTNNVIMQDGKHTFYMDLTFYSAGVQHVDFYVVANEGAMMLKVAPGSDSDLGVDVSLSETTTEVQLNSYWFNNHLRGNLETNGLPMYCKTENPVELDFTNLKAETAPAGSGHEGHTLLNQTVAFQLERPVGKIGVFAAKAAGETGHLHVTKLTMLTEGTQVRNYIMPQTDETLKRVLGGGRDIDIAVVADEVTAELPPVADPNDPTTDRTKPANYTPVMAEPFYPFENPWSNGGNWQIPSAERRGHAIEIEYDFDGTKRTRTVYLPRVVRNHYYAICCLIHNDGQIVVTYSVADWSTPPTDEGYNEDGEYELDFNYPQYTNPLQPASGAAPEPGQKYAQPTVWFNPSETSEEGSYTFRFEIRGPVNQMWKPVRDNGATAEDFDIKVYQIAADRVTREWKDFEGRTETKDDDCIASSKPYYIVVRALKAENVDKRMGLGISYARSWHPDGSSLLLINGLTHDLKWEGTTVAEYVVIKQIDVPSGQNTDEP